MSIPVVISEGSELLKSTYARRGFLPDVDPLAAFPAGSPYAALDEIGRDLPSDSRYDERTGLFVALLARTFYHAFSVERSRVSRLRRDASMLALQDS